MSWTVDLGPCDCCGCEQSVCECCNSVDQLMGDVYTVTFNDFFSWEGLTEDPITTTEVTASATFEIDDTCFRVGYLATDGAGDYELQFFFFCCEDIWYLVVTTFNVPTGFCPYLVFQLGDGNFDCCDGEQTFDLNLLTSAESDAINWIACGAPFDYVCSSYPHGGGGTFPPAFYNIPTSVTITTACPAVCTVDTDCCEDTPATLTVTFTGNISATVEITYDSGSGTWQAVLVDVGCTNPLTISFSCVDISGFVWEMALVFDTKTPIAPFTGTLTDCDPFLWSGSATANDDTCVGAFTATVTA